MNKIKLLAGGSPINETIQKVFFESGRNKIPDVALICSLTKADRKTVLNHLQEWWGRHDFLHQNDTLLSEIPEFQKSTVEEIALLKSYQDSLIHELELHSDSINHLPDVPYPLANSIIQSCLHIKNKLDHLLARVQQNEEMKDNLGIQLLIQLDECTRLNNELKEVTGDVKKKIAPMKCDLKAVRREANALRNLVKSLKKKSRNH